MKRIFVILIVLFTYQLSNSTDYSKIDSSSANVPNNLKTAGEIASYLCKDLQTHTEKARAIYFWMANNISYDLSMLQTNGYVSSKEELVKEILEKRKGVCANYAELFNECCNSVGIESHVINGYTLINQQVAAFSHAWNAVYIDGKYSLIDVTWASGVNDNGTFKRQFIDKYFLVQPEEMIKTHMPFDPIWQFLPNPIKNKEFEKSDYSKLKIAGNFNYTDSLNLYKKLDEYGQLLRETKRITEQGITNSLVRDYVAHNQHNIKVFKFNNSIADLNKAVEYYNIYILLKNKQFNNLSLSDEEVSNLILQCRNKIDSADNSLRFLSADDAELNKQISATLDSIRELRTNLDEEDRFVKKYLKTWKPVRLILFTKIVN